MKRIAAVLAVAAAASALAQSPGPAPAPPYPARAYPPPAPARPAFNIDYSPHPQGGTAVAVRAPDGTPCRITDERGLVAEGGAPLTARAHPGALYRIEVLPPGRPPLTAEVGATSGQTATAWAAIALPAVAIQPAPPPPMVVGPQAMNPDAFEDLLRALDRGGPEGRRLEQVKAAARRHHFVVDQVLDLIDAFQAGSSRVKVVEITQDRILDREHEGRLLERFTFPPERERVRRILARR